MKVGTKCVVPNPFSFEAPSGYSDLMVLLLLRTWMICMKVAMRIARSALQMTSSFSWVVNERDLL